MYNRLQVDEYSFCGHWRGKLSIETREFSARLTLVLIRKHNKIQLVKRSGRSHMINKL